MKKSTSVALLFTVIISVIFCSCKKETAQYTDCFPSDSTTRQVINNRATVKEYPAGNFYIIEKGAIDTRLNPCNLPSDYKVNDLSVTISGKVKATVHTTLEPCCTENFVLSQISR